VSTAPVYSAMYLHRAERRMSEADYTAVTSVTIGLCVIAIGGSIVAALYIQKSMRKLTEWISSRTSRDQFETARARHIEQQLHGVEVKAAALDAANLRSTLPAAASKKPEYPEPWRDYELDLEDHFVIGTPSTVSGLEGHRISESSDELDIRPFPRELKLNHHIDLYGEGGSSSKGNANGKEPEPRDAHEAERDSSSSPALTLIPPMSLADELAGISDADVSSPASQAAPSPRSAIAVV